jgi:hypothetical protein
MRGVRSHICLEAYTKILNLLERKPIATVKQDLEQLIEHHRRELREVEEQRGRNREAHKEGSV